MNFMIADGLIVDYTVNTAPPDYTVNTAPVACKDLVRKVVFGSTLLKISFYRERNKQAERKPKERTRLTWAKPRSVAK